MTKRKKTAILVAVVSVVAVMVVAVWQNEWIYKDVITGEMKTPKEVLAGFLFGSPTEIKKGFSPKLLEQLETHYQISIPDNAVFIKGFNTNAFRDPSVLILFECPITEELRQAKDDCIFAALGLDEAYWSLPGRADDMSPGEWADAMGGPWERQVEHKTEPYTYIRYSDSGDTLTVFFDGHHPHMAFP